VTIRILTATTTLFGRSRSSTSVLLLGSFAFLRFAHLKMNSFLSDLSALLTLHGSNTVVHAEELHEAVRLLDRNLCQLSVRVENVKNVSLGNLLRRKIPNEQARTGRKLIPSRLVDIFALLFQEMIILTLDISIPRSIVDARNLAGSKLGFTSALQRSAAASS
jgi:hypothetical protein